MYIIFDHVWLAHRGHKPLFVHSFFPRTFLKNSEGNKKAGDFFSKYGWGNIVKSFTNLFELRYSIIFWQIWAKASWHHHGQSWNDKFARSHLLYIGQAHQQFLEPLYSPAILFQTMFNGTMNWFFLLLHYRNLKEILLESL